MPPRKFYRYDDPAKLLHETLDKALERLDFKEQKITAIEVTVSAAVDAFPTCKLSYTQMHLGSPEARAEAIAMDEPEEME